METGGKNLVTRSGQRDSQLCKLLQNKVDRGILYVNIMSLYYRNTTAKVRKHIAYKTYKSSINFIPKQCVFEI